MGKRFWGGRDDRVFKPNPREEVDEELAFHLEERIREYVAGGMDPETARATAIARFGDVQGVRTACADLAEEQHRTTRRREWFGDLRQDLRFGTRSALRAPLFSLMAILTLALGIGANAAVFGVVKSVLLDTLPYRDVDRLVRIYARALDGSLERSGLSSGAAADLEARQRSFEAVAAFHQNLVEVTYATDDGAQVLPAAVVGAGFFETLGVVPHLGRTLGAADTAPGAPPVVVLTHETWRRLFGADPRVLGSSLTLDGDPHEVVGVLPRDFVGPIGEASLWFPLDQTAMLSNPTRARGSHWLAVIARLAPSATVESAERDLQAIAAGLAQEHPASDVGRTFKPVSLRDDMVGDTRTPLLLLMASAGLVLLIACANLAGAALSRSLSRRKEFAVRLALGAGRWRLIRQMLTETTLLSIAGGAAGLLLAGWSLSALRGLAGHALPAYAELSLDGGALLFASAIAILTGLAFGLAPALSVAGANMEDTLRDESRGASESRRSRRLRGMLVAAQLALCVSLLSGAGLLVRSLWELSRAPLGYDPDSVLTLRVQLPSREFPTLPTRAAFFEQFEERLRSLPGVTAVADTSELPMPVMNRNGLEIEGVVWPASEGAPFITFASVSPSYFQTLEIPLLKGRSFTAFDRIGTPSVIVISESMAKRYWPQGNAIGARVRLGRDASEPWSEVVGIVADVRNDPSRPTADPMAYASSRQETWGGRTFLLRAGGDLMGLVKPAQGELWTVAPGIPLRDVKTLRSALNDQLAGPRLPATLMAAFGGLALMLAAVGIYALFASMVAAREREFGIRVALGSTTQAIATLVLRQGALWMGIGLAGGATGIFVVARLLQGLLAGVSPFDPLAIAGTVGVLAVGIAAALMVPVRRATRVDPASVLR